MADADTQQEAGRFDPSEHDAEEVQAYLNQADESERERVIDAEREGKKRKTVLNHEPTRDPVQAETPAQGGEVPEGRFPARRLIAEATDLLGVPSHVAAGALYEEEGELTVTQARERVEAFRTRPVETEEA